MTSPIILALISFGILVSGVYIALCPQVIVNKLRSFYSQYPLVHYAGEKQLTSRLFFVRILGGVLVFIGLIILYSSLGL